MRHPQKIEKGDCVIDKNWVIAIVLSIKKDYIRGINVHKFNELGKKDSCYGMTYQLHNPRLLFKKKEWKELGGDREKKIIGLCFEFLD
jgi:hypothetical protein